jgi:hypothetical protein
VESAVQGYECVQCSATFQTTGPLSLCVFCQHPIKARPQLNVVWDGPALPLRHDRASFVEAIAQFMHSIKRGAELSLAAYQIPASAVPVWMPFRRVRARAEAKLKRAANGAVPQIRQEVEIDLFCGVGLEEALIQELQEFAPTDTALPQGALALHCLRTGEASDDDLGVRAAISLRRWLAAQQGRDGLADVTARYLEAPEAGRLYWMPIWLHGFELNGEHCVLAMDAVEGRLVARLPRAPQPIDYLKHLLPLTTQPKEPPELQEPPEPNEPQAAASGNAVVNARRNTAANDAANDAAKSPPLAHHAQAPKPQEPMGIRQRTPQWLYWPYDRLGSGVIIGLSCFTAASVHRLELLVLALVMLLGGALSRAYLSQARRFARSGLVEDWEVFRHFRNLNLLVQAITLGVALSMSVYWSQHHWHVDDHAVTPVLQPFGPHGDNTR